MKPRILNYRIDATHDTITPLGSIQDPRSISDFHAFTIDPNGFHGDAMQPDVFLRRRGEVEDLIQKKGGIIICLLRPNNLQVQLAGIGMFDKYSLLDRAGGQISRIVAGNIRSGTGSSVKTIPSARGPTSAYFQVLRQNLQFEACLGLTEPQLAQHLGVTFAVNSVGYPISVQFRSGEGVVCFVPVPRDVPGDRVGAAIVKVVMAHFTNESDMEVPLWAQEISVPGAQAHDTRIADLTSQRERLSTEISTLEATRDEVTKNRRLLFGYGKGILEPQVRTALRILGFAVREPEEYQGEWDVEAADGGSGATAIGEVEGSEGPIDVDKSRQLLDYIEAEAIEGRDHKGILIGNGFRLTPLEAPERQQQFSDHARRAAERFQFCLLATTELFKAVCAVLENLGDEELKARIRESLFRTVGPWSFARAQGPHNRDP